MICHSRVSQNYDVPWVTKRAKVTKRANVTKRAVGDKTCQGDKTYAPHQSLLTSHNRPVLYYRTVNNILTLDPPRDFGSRVSNVNK